MRESFIKSDIDARKLKRAIAVRMALSGNIYHEISKILGVSIFFVIGKSNLKPKASPESN